MMSKDAFPYSNVWVKEELVIYISLSRDNGKITRKEMSKLFFQNYHYHHGMVKCRRNVNFEKKILSVQQEKNMDFEVFWDFEWGIFKEYINIIMAVLRKASSHSVVICRMIKKLIM